MSRLANLYWTFLISVASAVVVGSVGYGMWELFASNDDVAPQKTGAGIVGFNREQLQVLVQTFEKQKSGFEALMAH